MARTAGRFQGFKRASGLDVSRIAVAVYVCRGCEKQAAPGKKPQQCECGRMDFARFDSTGEARRWATLRLLEMHGKIFALERQVRFPLMAWDSARKMPVKVGVYVADFVYQQDGKRVIEDFKGAITDLAQWKLRHMEAQGAPVTLTRA